MILACISAAKLKLHDRPTQSEAFCNFNFAPTDFYCTISIQFYVSTRQLSVSLSAFERSPIATVICIFHGPLWITAQHSSSQHLSRSPFSLSSTGHRSPLLRASQAPGSPQLCLELDHIVWLVTIGSYVLYASHGVTSHVQQSALLQRDWGTVWLFSIEPGSLAN